MQIYMDVILFVFHFPLFSMRLFYGKNMYLFGDSVFIFKENTS